MDLSDSLHRTLRQIAELLGWMRRLSTFLTKAETPFGAWLRSGTGRNTRELPPTKVPQEVAASHQGGACYVPLGAGVAATASFPTRSAGADPYGLRGYSVVENRVMGALGGGLSHDRENILRRM